MAGRDEEQDRIAREARRVERLEADKAQADAKRVHESEEELAAWQKARTDAANWMTVEEQAEAKRKRLYAIHKARDSLHIYYHMYPDERPRSQEPEREQGRENEGRSR